MKKFLQYLMLAIFFPLLSFSQLPGKKILSVEPTAQAQHPGFGNIKSYTYKLGFSEANPAAESYIVLRKISSPFISEVPADGVTYVKGSYIGNAQVVYVGRPDTITPSYVVAGTKYYFRIFSFNGSGGSENYLTTNPAEDSVTSLGNMMGSYYDGIDSQSPNFMNELHNRINPHATLDYGQYDENLIANYESRDTSVLSVSNKVVTCSYSGYIYLYSGIFTWGVFSREHIFCQSWMPNSDHSSPQYSDYHHLIPTQQNNANALRSNNPLGNVVTVTQHFLAAKLGKDINGKTVFEPRGEQKGDDARALFYMLICYNGAGGLEWNLPAYQDELVLKQWNTIDPPDSWEIARNDYIYSIQGNRNPFIDHPEWAELFDFTNMVYVGINDNNKHPELLLIYPNPAKDIVFIRFNENLSPDTHIFIQDLDGKKTVSVNCETSGNLISVNLSELNLSKGLYLLTAISRAKIVHQKILVQ